MASSCEDLSCKTLKNCNHCVFLPLFCVGYKTLCVKQIKCANIVSLNRKANIGILVVFNITAAWHDRLLDNIVGMLNNVKQNTVDFAFLLAT